MRDEILKGIGSVKMHSPYGHFRKDNEEKEYDDKYYPYGHFRKDHDGKYYKITGIMCPSYMLSCDKADSEVVEFELRKAERNDLGSGSKFFKLSKEITRQ